MKHRTFRIVKDAWGRYTPQELKYLFGVPYWGDFDNDHWGGDFGTEEEAREFIEKLKTPEQIIPV